MTIIADDIYEKFERDNYLDPEQTKSTETDQEQYVDPYDLYQQIYDYFSISQNDYKNLITEKYDYAMRCLKYLDEKTIDCQIWGASSNITDQMTLETCIKNAKFPYDLPIYYRRLCETIVLAHYRYNEKLKEYDTTKYLCPSCFCDDCYAFAVDFHTSQCGQMICWDTSQIDWTDLKTFNLDCIYPVGLIVSI